MHMTGSQWLTGAAVILATMLCGAASGRWAERTFARPEQAATQDGAAHPRTCITIGGKRFEWNSPNVPFGTLSCSD